MRELRPVPVLSGVGVTPCPSPPTIRPRDDIAPLRPRAPRVVDDGTARVGAPSGSLADAPGADDVVAYTDGACSGNPGPGGWAAVITDGGVEREISGAEAHTTNQRMELRAVLEALRAVTGRRRVHVYSDSAYVINCFRDRWYDKWERSGWMGTGRQAVVNRDLWEPLIAETRRHDVVWHKVRGHSGDVMNDRVDRLARAACVSAAR